MIWNILPNVRKDALLCGQARLIDMFKVYTTNLNNFILETNVYLYIRNLKYAHLTPIFRQHNIHLVSSTYQHKLILCTEKLVLNASFQDF